MWMHVYYCNRAICVLVYDEFNMKKYTYFIFHSITYLLYMYNNDRTTFVPSWKFVVSFAIFYRTNTVIRFFSSSKFSCQKLSRRLIFVQIELNENFFTSRVNCIIIFVKKIFVLFCARKYFYNAKKRITVLVLRLVHNRPSISSIYEHSPCDGTLRNEWNSGTDRGSILQSMVQTVQRN